MAKHSGPTRKQRKGERAGARPAVLLLAVFLLGIAVSALWFRAKSNQVHTESPPVASLSDTTRTVLSHLDSPLEIRFYAVLDTATVPDTTTAFASRVNQLVSDYQQEAGDKIKVTRFDSASNLKPNAAPADGIHAFNLEKGEACYLGLALEYKGRKESIPRLSPEWEQALEPDLTRTIARLVEAARPVPAPVAVSQVNTNAVKEVRALIPDLTAVSVEEGSKILREAALKDFKAAASELEAQVKEAQQRLAAAQGSGSETNLQAAVKYLQQVQAEQTEKLKQIAARSKAQIDALQQIKAASR